MNPAFLLMNPHITDKVLAAGGMFAGLSQKDVRELASSPVPVWAVVLGSLAIGFAGGIWATKRMPDSWVNRLRRPQVKA